MIIVDFTRVHEFVDAILRHGSLFDDTIRIDEVQADGLLYIVVITAIARAPILWRCKLVCRNPIMRETTDAKWLAQRRAYIASECKRLEDAGVKFKVQPGAYSEESRWPYGTYRK